jgi:hypothetical protein
MINPSKLQSIISISFAAEKLVSSTGTPGLLNRHELLLLKIC